MARDVQQQGGTFADQNVFVGLPRQITVEMDNMRILLHDGQTPGGRMFISRDESDQRYQQTNEELQGFTNFPVPGRGFLVRIGVGGWVIRSFEAEAPISVARADGRIGNPLFTLAAEIPGERTFSGAVTFSEPTTGEKWIGETEGKHTGASEGTHTGDVTGDVTGNLQGNSEGNHLGGLDARGHEVFFDVNQIPLEAIEGLATALAGIPGGIPSGIVVDWSGAANDIPIGWLLCDGTNGTPDLRNTFIIGAGDQYEPHAGGGSITAFTAGTIQEAGSHTHNAEIEGHALTTAEMPGHTHTNGVTDGGTSVFNHGTVAANPNTADSIDNNSANGIHEGVTSSTGGGQEHNHDIGIVASGDHTHVFEGGEIDIMPPYYALCKIMKA